MLQIGLVEKHNAKNAVVSCRSRDLPSQADFMLDVTTSVKNSDLDYAIQRKGRLLAFKQE